MLRKQTAAVFLLIFWEEMERGAHNIITRRLQITAYV